MRCCRFKLGSIRAGHIELNQHLRTRVIHASAFVEYARTVAIKSRLRGVVSCSEPAGPRAFLGFGWGQPGALRPTLAEHFFDLRDELACHDWFFQENHIVPIGRGSQARPGSISRHQESRRHEAIPEKPAEKVNAVEFGHVHIDDKAAVFERRRSNQKRFARGVTTDLDTVGLEQYMERVSDCRVVVNDIYDRLRHDKTLQILGKAWTRTGNVTQLGLHPS